MCMKWTQADLAVSICPSIRLSVCVIQLKNYWTDLDVILYGCYTIGVNPVLEMEI
jgi:hypothetical protein